MLWIYGKETLGGYHIWVLRQEITELHRVIDKSCVELLLDEQDETVGIDIGLRSQGGRNLENGPGDGCGVKNSNPGLA